ncbi:MAG TPA: prolipoprotein diacylglyceryl transferase, partial [Chloroflexi bacterium]|nr:prolipoprotein diacylglyceryl transferase [Chloroflexota bacterium]
MYPNLSIGPASIPSCPLFVLLALWAGMWLGAKEAERLGIDGDHIYNIGIYGLLAGLIGGRAWYALSHWEAYAKNAIQSLALTINAIALPEAFIFALAAIVIYIKVHKLLLPVVVDAIASGAALAMLIGGVGAFLGSQTLGTPTSLLWGIEQFGQLRHPAHLYQVVANLVILAVVWKMRLNPRWP